MERLIQYLISKKILFKKLKLLLEILENLFKIRNSLIKEKIKLYIKKRLKNNE